MAYRERRHPLEGGTAVPGQRYVVCAAALLAFVVLAFTTASEGVHQTEATLLTSISSVIMHHADPPAWLQAVARDVTALGSEVVLGGLSLGTIGLLIVLGVGPALRFMLMSVVGGAAIAGMLKLAFSRPRPDLLPHGDYVFTPSFPSGHATMTAVVFLSLAFIAAAQSGFVARVYIVGAAVIAMITVGLSRIMLGVHWPSDVLGGWLLGIAWVIFCARLLLRPDPEDGPLH